MLRKFFLVILVLSFLSIAWAWNLYLEILIKPVVDTAVTVEIDQGDSFNKITQKLIASGVQINPIWLKAIAFKEDISNKLKVGEYELTPGLTTPQILAMFVEGRAKKYTITFPEGLNLKEIIQEIEKSPQIKKNLSNVSISDIPKQLGITEVNLEGWVFPDTYYYEKNATDVSILKRTYNKMQSVLAEEWQNKATNLPYKSPYEALIMASIVEKETGAISERPMIAGVFIRRLNQGMLLQTDPTVIYGMGDKYKGNIRATDLTTATPYNTYVISGLPPTPIAMPGREAIHAALHPDNSDKLYFVAKGDGSHQFSATLTEHNRAVNSFQKHNK